jgi:ferredoxin
MPNPCQPLDVCLIVGEPFSSFVLEHNPADCRAITQDEARQILEDENKRGHVAHAYFKDAVLNRFYAICNCCSCCCGAMKAHRSGTPMIISSGYTIKVNRETCLACGDCVSSCQFGALSVNGELQINCDACMGCGVCVSHCPQEALFLERDETKPAPLELEELIQVSSI